MTEQEFQKIVEKLDKEIIMLNKTKRNSRFEGECLIKSIPGDSAVTKALIEKYNHKVRVYNGLGGELYRRIQMAIDKHVASP